MKNKQIEEMHELSQTLYMSGYGLDWKDSYDIGEQLYNAGYRKSTEVAEEIFAEVEGCFDKMIDEATNELSSARLEYDLKAVKFLHYHIDVLRMACITIGTIQNKYIGKDTNVTTKESESNK